MTSEPVLPSPGFFRDDIEYFAPGPEFELVREEATRESSSASYWKDAGDVQYEATVKDKGNAAVRDLDPNPGCEAE